MCCCLNTDVLLTDVLLSHLLCDVQIRSGATLQGHNMMETILELVVFEMDFKCPVSFLLVK